MDTHKKLEGKVVGILVNDTTFLEDITKRKPLQHWVADSTDDSDWEKAGEYAKRFELIASALQRCEWRGHRVLELNSLSDQDGYTGHCEDCGSTVVVVFSPYPNQVFVAGDAVSAAISCGEQDE